MDTITLRQNFTTYMKERFPNDMHISATISTAFFLERKGKYMGVDFQEVLTEGNVPEACKQKLEDYFAENGNKDPRAQAAVYERALRLLLEFIRDHESQSKPKKKAKLSVDIPQPSKQGVLHYLAKWEKLEGYTLQERALNRLVEKFPSNNNIEEVLIKCCVLNAFYATQIFDIKPIARHIVRLAIDTRLQAGDPQLVNDVAVGHGQVSSKTGMEKNLFSFATKYCSHHNPRDYPIYDSYVEKVLIYFRKKDSFSDFSNDDLRNHHIFKKAIFDFRKAYSLNEFSIKQIDQYLWLLGKEKFPKTYY